MKRIRRTLILFTFFFILTPLFAQEVLKSYQEDYYDFLALQGIIARPTLNYRTLSDNEWVFNSVFNLNSSFFYPYGKEYGKRRGEDIERNKFTKQPYYFNYNTVNPSILTNGKFNKEPKKEKFKGVKDEYVQYNKPHDITNRGLKLDEKLPEEEEKESETEEEEKEAEEERKRRVEEIKAKKKRKVPLTEEEKLILKEEKKKKSIKRQKTPAKLSYNLHLWEKVNTGSTFALYRPDNKTLTERDNWYLRGIKRGVFLKVYGPEWFNSINTGYPYGQNDGALWQGRGYNTKLTAGVRMEGYGVEVTFRPEFVFSENINFDYPSGVYKDEYSYFHKGNIDLVQRFGDKPVIDFDLGDTEVRYSLHSFTIGIGFQSPWLGPASVNSVLGSNNAPSYPKIDIGLRRQRIVIPGINCYLGDIEGRMWAGILQESEHYNKDSSDDKRLITGFSVAYSPSFLKGFTISFNKICIANWKNKDIKYFNPFYASNGSKHGSGADEDQKMSIGFDYLCDKIGLEVYGEIGMDDYTSKKLPNPFHTMIWTVGAKKTIPIIKKYGIYAEILFELNNFELSKDFLLQWHYMGFYAHGSVGQGYTNKGQLLGAGSGYFGNSQYAEIKVYHKKGFASFFMHFDRPDTNYIDNYALDLTPSTTDSKGNTMETYRARYKATRIFGGQLAYYPTEALFLSLGVAGMFTANYNYEKAEGQTNVNITFMAKYNF